MDPLTIIAIIQALAGFAADLPELVAAAETAVGLIRTNTAPTPEQQAQIDAALDVANTKLAAS